MISVYLSPDITQIIRAEKKKKSLVIKAYNSFPQSFLDAFDNLDNIDIEELEQMFVDIQEAISTKHDTVSIVLPDYLFEMIDCFPFNLEQDIEEHITIALNRPITDFYYSVPLIIRPQPLEKDATVCVIDKRVVDALSEAADNANIRLESIEPASISKLRCSDDFNNEQLSFFQYKSKAVFSAYSPICGLFIVPARLSRDDLNELSVEDADNRIKSDILELDQAASQTFEYFTEGVKIDVFAKKFEMNDFSYLRSRENTVRDFPGYIVNEIIPSDEEYQFLVAAGTLLQCIDFSDAYFSNIFDSSILSLQPGSVLPVEIRKNAKSFLALERLKMFFKYGIAACIAISLIEIIAISFLSATVVPTGLKNEYDAAQKEVAGINKELEILKLYTTENQYPIEGFTAIMQSRPGGLGYTSVDIGQKTAKDAWIKIHAVSSDPMLFQDYVSSLALNPIFSNITIKAINSDAGTGYKKAEILLTKGELPE